MVKKTNKKQEAYPKTFAIITAIYKELAFESIPIELEDDSPNTQLFLDLSETGTTDMKMIKFPTDVNKFVIFSKEQINETLFEIEIIEEEVKEKTIKEKLKV